jgi:hypothetical protein
LGSIAGPIGRLTTGNDAALISLLVDAQIEEIQPRTVRSCPLPLFRRRSVINPDEPAIRLAGIVALLTAAIKVADHVADGDSIRLSGRWGQRLAARWRTKAEKASRSLDFPAHRIVRAAGEQTQREAIADRPFRTYSEPTERSVGTAFRHTALLAGRPENRDTLYEAGRCFGRIVYLLDAFRDIEEDKIRGTFNPFADHSPGEIGTFVSREYRESGSRLREALDAAVLSKPALLTRLVNGTLNRNRPRPNNSKSGTKVDEDVDESDVDIDEIGGDPGSTGEDQYQPTPDNQGPCPCDGGWICCDGGCGDGGCGDCDCGDCDCGDCDCGDAPCDCDC